MSDGRVRFCSACGAPVIRRLVEADARERDVCSACGAIHYQNPRILVTCIVEHQGRILLCQRAQAPAIGRWTTPAGFMEIGESLQQAAVRETHEECGVVLDENALDLHMVSSIPWMGEVYVCFTARAPSADVAAGPESQDVRYFDEHDIPWDELAFVETRGYLQIYLSERARHHHTIHVTNVDARGGRRRAYHVAGVSDVFEADPASSRPR
ncbi:MAG TPA: NUDIX hydrolase [Nevskiaceae bacterium]|nr:NUDIX hydrolase [Nevskiaceae bacterium]